MKIVLSILLFFITCNSSPVSAIDLYYPLENTLQRQQFKKFGQYIDKNFYQNTGNLYPSKYIGYHTGTDLEIFPTEEKEPDPVYAVSDGEILFVGPVSGYGGLILLKVSNNLTFLYGHLNLSIINLKTKDKVYAGQKIAYLGDAFSSQTGGERKHLHFAMYQGSEIYFKGYENDKTTLNNKFLDPISFLKIKSAKDFLTQETVISISPSINISPPKNSIKLNFWGKIYSLIFHIFNN